MLGADGSGRNVVVMTDGAVPLHVSAAVHWPSPAWAGDITGVMAGGTYGGGNVVVVDVEATDEAYFAVLGDTRAGFRQALRTLCPADRPRR